MKTQSELVDIRLLDNYNNLQVAYLCLSIASKNWRF